MKWVIVFMLLPLSAPAADYYVDATRGNPSNDGLEESPWAHPHDLFKRRLLESRTWPDLPHKGGMALVPRNAGAPVKAGDTIDFLAGEKRRAPRWMQKAGLEWLFRCLSEPRRLIGRYARDAWHFPQLVWCEWRARAVKA